MIPFVVYAYIKNWIIAYKMKNFAKNMQKDKNI